MQQSEAHSTNSQDSGVSGKRLFSFAVISDTHLNEDDEQCNSPFAVNQLANRRLRYVIDDLNRRDLSHVIHLGDVVHPVPSMGHLYSESAAQFHAQIKHLKHPIHIIPGNHDVGDKPIKWGPSGTVRDSFLNAWTEHFGAHYFKVVQQGLHFIGINAQLLGSGLALEIEQQQWLQESLDTAQGQRIFLFTHYPPFLLETDEQEHYDNLSPSSRQWLLGLVERYQIEALFAGHVHHFWYNRHQNCQCYLLPSTAFTRQDYSEMFRLNPADPEFGRNDKAKLGYLLIHVHENGHSFEMVRCGGNEVDGGNSRPANKTSKTVPAINAMNNQFPLLGFDLRQDWMETVQIPPSGGLDEFDRKRVRNDYALLALWEMGVKKLRIPVTDLLSAERRQRIRDLKALGFEFTLYSFGLPKWNSHLSLKDVLEHISAWEICWSLEDIETLKLDIEPLLPQLIDTIPLHFSPLRSKADIVNSGRKYYHVINHGFTVHDKTVLEQLNALKETAPIFSGFTLRCGLQDSAQETIEYGASLQAASNMQTAIHLRLSGDNPAELIADEDELCKRIESAMRTAKAHNVESVFCDTLADNDRGYFPRLGVLDRLYNPKAGFYTVKQLHTEFNA